MARTSTALKSISAPRKHKQKTHKSAPLTQQQKKEKQARREEKQAAIGRAFHEWHSATMAKAEELAIQFNRKPRYFLDLFFHGGAKMVNQRTSVTAWNAWSSKIMEEENDGAHHIRWRLPLINRWVDPSGSKENLLDVQQSRSKEYHALSKEEKEDLIQEFQHEKDDRLTAPRLSSKARIQDITNTARNMENLVIKCVRFCDGDWYPT
jgi:hypothetical protein